VDADYNRKTGLIGNGSTKWVMTNRNNNADAQNNQSFGVWINTVTSSSASAAYYIGAGITDAGSSLILRRGTPNDAGIAVRSQTATGDTSLSAAGTTTGLVGISRAASASYTARVGGSNSTITQASQTPLDRQMAVFATQGVSAPFGFIDGRLQFYWQGSALNMALLEARISTYLTAIAAAIP
jgi:hypothetical protein